jgi:hypothetical protein
LMKKEKMNSDMAYGIAWIQYKNEFCEDWVKLFYKTIFYVWRSFYGRE